MNVAAWLRRQLRNGRDGIELFLLPGLALVLPWRLCFRLYRHLAGCDWLYRRETSAALAVAAAQGLAGDAVVWTRAFRLTRLVDHADLYLSRFRGGAWMRRHLRLCEGDWPDDGRPFLAITFHWASGLWGLRHLRDHRGPAAVLVRDIPAGAFAGRPLLGLYARLRTAETAAAGGTGVIYADARSLAGIRRRLGDGMRVVALLDVPVEAGQQSLACDLLGQPAHFPRGLLYLAVNRRIPVVVYEVSVDRASGQRLLRVECLGVADDEQALLGRLVARLERLVRADPPSWHHWPGLAAFRRDGAAAEVH